MPKLTLATCLFDISKRDPRFKHRTAQELIDKGAYVFDLDQNIVFFVDPEFADAVRERRRGKEDRTLVVPIRLEDLEPYKWYEAVAKGRKQQNLEAARCVADYILMGWSKFAILQHLADERPFDATHLGWIDLGLGATTANPKASFAAPSDKFKLIVLRHFSEVDAVVPDFWNYVNGRVVAGLMTGDVEHVAAVSREFMLMAQEAVDRGYSPIDEDILPAIAVRHPDLFCFTYGDYSDVLQNYDCIRTSTGLDAGHGGGNLLFQMVDARQRKAWQHSLAIGREVYASHKAGIFAASAKALDGILLEYYLAAYYESTQDEAREVALYYAEQVTKDLAFKQVFEAHRSFVERNFAFLKEPIVLPEHNQAPVAIRPRLTIVTCLFDLATRDGTKRRSVDEYLKLGEFVFALDQDIVFFIDPSIADAVHARRLAYGKLERTVIIPVALEDLECWRHKVAVDSLPMPDGCRPDKDTANFTVLTWAKFELLQKALARDPFKSTHFAWMDFGIAYMADTEMLPFDAPSDLVSLLVLQPFDADYVRSPDYWKRLQQNVAATYFVGSRENIARITQAFWQAVELALSIGYRPLEQEILTYLVVQEPSRFSLRRGFYRDVLRAFKPLLGLVMIVKNEAHGITKTLDTFKPYIDYWTILDTGSTDGTQDMIRQVLSGIPGELREEPFVDFATSRNRALDLHGTKTVFTVMPDSDDQLVNADGLRAFLAGCGPSTEAFMVNIRRGNLSYYLPLVLRSTAGWRYKGRVHECCGRDGASPAGQIPSAVLTQNRPPQSQEATNARFSRDLGLLQADLDADPTNSRAAFYLAQTYECLGRPQEAAEAYRRRIAMGGWADETFEAKLRLAKILDHVTQWPEAQQAYLDAYAFDPRRAEPLYGIAKHWYDAQEHSLAYLFGSQAVELPLPDTSLFVDADVYAWKAADLVGISGFYHAAKRNDRKAWETGKRAAEHAVVGKPYDDRLRSNLAFYAKSAAETFTSYRDQQIGFKPEAPYFAMNPSIHFDGEEWRCVVRTVNYHIVEGRYLTPDDNIIYTRNFMVELADDLSVERAVEMIDHDAHPRSSFPVHGFEDCRLFSWQGKLYCTSTSCDLNDERGMREIVMLHLDDDYSIREAQPLRGVWSSQHQKNWMPLVQGNELHFIYSTKPEIVFGYKDGAVDDHGAGHMTSGRLRGGSQAVRIPGGWLFLVHDVVWSGRRIYQHRFVLMNDDFKVVRASDPFYFQQRGIEFCAGLGYDGKKLVASYSTNDAAAYLGVFELEDVLKQLREGFVV
jgi:tetratricopeptide (TPR) repeat protein/predicted GH43/DUF377 family glycosyl hydrolase